MSITDELREYADGFSGPFYGHGERLRKIADRIDAAHCKALGDTAAAAYAVSAESVPIAVDENAWVRLPVDADGVPIRVGDVMTWMDEEYHATVDSLGIFEDGWWVYTGGQRAIPEHLRHHHAPTVEDVLREFADRYLDYEGMPSAGRRGVGEALMDEYVAKLRLAGEDE